MVNSATVRSGAMMIAGRQALAGRNNDIIFAIPYVVFIDTTGADLTIRTPAAGNKISLVGISYSLGVSHSLTFKSGATTLLTLPITDGGVVKEIGRPLFFTADGEALVISSTVAIPSMLIHVVESSEIYVL